MEMWDNYFVLLSWPLFRLTSSSTTFNNNNNTTTMFVTRLCKCRILIPRPDPVISFEAHEILPNWCFAFGQPRPNWR
ncbi:unnamed protein product [Tenebrio molitor]|nr:unnamed protein product [Tenebrio molitor]